MKIAKVLFLIGAMLLAPAISSATEYFVDISGLAFNPPDLTVSEGDIVTWTNNDGIIPHTSTSDTGVWDSGILSNGQSFSYTFTTAGTYPYHCEVHLAMTGTITVNPNNVPTLSEWGMILMGLLLIGAGTVAVIRRRKLAPVKQ